MSRREVRRLAVVMIGVLLAALVALMATHRDGDR